jgi:pimeloyl-ACP methyl ester carboxylesterase
VEQFRRGELVFDVQDRGPADGSAETVILLHGFPETSASWDGVAPIVSASGYRTLAPDQRGYSPGARPEGRSAYRSEELVADVLALADAAGADRFHLVGHDFGASVAWSTAALHADRVLSLTAVSVPHPQAFTRAMRRSVQALKSWYMVPFQLPALPERAMLAGGGRMLRRTLESSGLPPALAARYVERLREPGALTAALNWYRALLPRPTVVGDVDVPTLYVWSTGDRFITSTAAYECGRHVVAPYRFEVLEGVSHWVPAEAPDRLAAAILAHLAEHADQ